MMIGTFFFTKMTITKKGEIFGFCLFAFLLFIAIPVFFQRILSKHRLGLFFKITQKRIGSLYLGIRTEEMITVYSVFVFLSVKVWFVALTFAVARIPCILINMYMFLNNLNIFYLGWYWPYDTWA
jgi:hypothetical protein